MSSAKEIFTNIFTQKVWGDHESFSGPGSSNYYSQNLAEKLEIILPALDIKSMIDLPCGDGNFIKHLDLKNIQYNGYDLVEGLIEINKERFDDKPNMKFELADAITADFPKVDLVFCRDLIIHFPLNDIAKLLANLKRSDSKWLMISHYYHVEAFSAYINMEIEMGHYRPVNLCSHPFNFPQPILSIPELDIGKTMALWDLQALELPN